METLTDAGRRYAEAHRESIVARVALMGYESEAGWPAPFVATSIKVMNEEGARALLSESEFREQLEERAAGMASDIAGDNPELDTGYECYVYEVDGRLAGYVYMGDAGEWSFAEVEPGRVEMEPTLLDRVKALSPYREW